MSSLSQQDALNQISAQLASSKDGGYLEKIANKLNATSGGSQNDPFAGFKIPQLTDIAKGLTFGLAPGLIKKSVAGMQIFMDSLNSMNIDDVEKSGKIIQLVDGYSTAMTKFGNIPWMKALKGTFLLQTFTERFTELGTVLGSRRNLIALIPFKNFAMAFGVPLKLIGTALSSFAKIKWTSVFISTMFLKRIMESLKAIGEVFVGSEQTFEMMGVVMEKLTEPLIAFGEAFKQIGNTLLKASVSLLIVAASLGLAALSLKLFAGMPQDAIITGMGTLAALMGSVALLSKFAKEAIKGAAALAIVSASLGIAALSLRLFSGIDEKALKTAGDALLGMVVTLVAVGAIMASGVGGGAILAGAAALALVGLSLIPFALGVKILGGVNWKGFEYAFEALKALGLGIGIMVPAIPAMIVGAIALIPFALSLKMLSGVNWKSFDGIYDILKSIGDGAKAISAFALLKAGYAMIPFAAGITLLRIAVGSGQTLPKFLKTFKDSLNDLDGESLLSASKGIFALSGALVTFAGSQVVSGVGTLIGKILRFGSDSPIEQLIKLAKHGYNLSILGMGVRDLSAGLKTLAGFTSELDIFDTLTDKFKSLNALDPTGIKAFAEGINSLAIALTALSALDGKLSVLDQIPFDKLKSLSESIKPGAPLIQIVNGLKESEQSKETAAILRKGIQLQPPTVGTQLGNSGNISAAPVVIINNSGGNVTNNSSTSSNVNNNGSVNTPIITASGSGMFTDR